MLFHSGPLSFQAPFFLPLYQTHNFHHAPSLFRHPSYAGFFYWAVGTQILLTNPIVACAFAYVLYTFFKERIEFEEAMLVSFFGERYVRYRMKVGVWIPGLE